MKMPIASLVSLILIAGLAAFASPRQAHAGPGGIAGTALFQQFPMLYQGVIPLGMGGAFTAVADDENAVFYNPAGLDNVQDASFKIINVSADVTYPNMITLYNNASADSKLPAGNTQDQAYINDFNSFAGQSLYARVGDYSNYTTHDFSIGLLTNNQLLAVPAAAATTNNLASLYGLSDSGIVVSGAYGFFNHHLQIGGTVMGLNQMFLNIPSLSVSQASTLQSTINSNLTHGLGIVGDIGAIYHFDLPLNPTIGATIENVGTADFGQAGTLPQLINAGVGLDPDIGFGRLLVDIDYDDVANYLYYTGESLWQHTHFGVQYQFPVLLTLSAGVYEGYPTFGFGLDLWAFMLNGSYYTEEAGVSPGQNPNHIVSLQVAFGWM